MLASMTPGFLLIDKPAGPTSHDVVSRVRRVTGEKRVGHAGTLDPFASGLLLVGVGREATRELGRFVGLDKWYDATFVIGAGSDTDDITGHIEPDNTFVAPPEDAIRNAMETLTGHLNQIPPSYAAIKIGGKKMYELAREGKTFDKPPRPVTIFSFELLTSLTTYKLPATTSFLVRIHCSSGTYIRSLARDLGKALGTRGLVAELRRTSIGPFTISEATPLADLANPVTVADIPFTLSRLPPSATIDA